MPPRSSKPRLRTKKSEPSAGVKLLAESRTDELDDQEAEDSDVPRNLPRKSNDPSSHQHSYLKAILQIIAIAFAAIFGFQKLVETSLKDVKRDIQLLECKNDALIECRNCNLQQIITKQNSCKNTTK